MFSITLRNIFESQRSWEKFLFGFSFFYFSFPDFLFPNFFLFFFLWLCCFPFFLFLLRGFLFWLLFQDGKLIHGHKVLFNANCQLFEALLGIAFISFLIYLFCLLPSLLFLFLSESLLFFCLPCLQWLFLCVLLVTHPLFFLFFFQAHFFLLSSSLSSLFFSFFSLLSLFYFVSFISIYLKKTR